MQSRFTFVHAAPPISAFLSREPIDPRIHPPRCIYDHRCAPNSIESSKLSPSNSIPSSPPNNKLLPRHFFRSKQPGLSQEIKDRAPSPQELNLFRKNRSCGIATIVDRGSEKSSERSGEHGRRDATVLSMYERIREKFD